MKHHKDWAKELRQASSVALNGTLVMIEPLIQQIQLDAMKEGMRRSVKKVTKLADEMSKCPRIDQNWAARDTYLVAAENILTAAEQLTEKNLS